MNILFAATSEKVENGAAKCLIELVKELNNKGYNTYVAVPNYGSMFDELNKLGINCIMFRERHSWAIKGDYTLRVRVKGLTNVLTIIRIMHFIRSKKIDVVHVNAITAYTVGLAALLVKAKLVWHIREFLEEDINVHFANPKRSRKIVSKANRIIAISKPIKDKWEQELNADIKVINDGLPVDDYYIETKKKHDGINVIIYGRITQGKGQLFFVRSVADVLNRIKKKANFFYAGTIQDVDYYQEIKKFISDNKLDDNIHYLGDVKNVKELLSEMDITCVCSKREGFGRVTVESLLAKSLVLGANTGATCEIIEDGINGIIYEYDNQNDFVEKLSNIIDNYENYKELISSGQDKAKSKYSLDYDVEQIMSLYSELAQEGY